MRVIALLFLLVSLAMFATACGGPDDPEKRLAEACERQIKEVADGAKEGSVPVAKSNQAEVDETTLVECAGQHVKVTDADDETSKDDGTKPDSEEGNNPDAGDGEGTGEPVELDPAARELFATSCGGCHALSDAETTGAVGPNLDDTDMDSTAVASQIQNGGGGMPPALLEGDEAEAVAEYVAAAAAAAK